MAAKMVDIDVWVMVNDQGEYVAHEDEACIADEYAERIGELADAGGLHRVKLTVGVPLPEVIELKGEVSATEECSALKVA